MKTNYFVLIGCILLLISCKSTQKLTIEKPKENIIKQENIFSLIQKNQTITDFNQIRIKGEIALNLNENYPDLNLNLYLEKDTKIWSNVNFLIFSARSLITPDKFQAYEKIKKTYIDSDFQYLNNLLGLDFIDFKSTQNLLLGKLFFPFDENDFNSENKENEIIYTSKNPIKITNKKGVFYYDRVIKFNSDFSLRSILFIDKTKNESINIDYENKIQNGNLILPNLIKVKILSSDQKEIILKYTSFDTEKMETPFKIPENYTKRNF